MAKAKQLLLTSAVVGQLLGIVMLFINIIAAILIFILSGVAIIGVFILLIVERINEKEEDDQNDYRDY